MRKSHLLKNHEGRESGRARLTSISSENLAPAFPTSQWVPSTSIIPLALPLSFAEPASESMS